MKRKVEEGDIVICVGNDKREMKVDMIRKEKGRSVYFCAYLEKEKHQCGRWDVFYYRDQLIKIREGDG